MKKKRVLPEGWTAYGGLILLLLLGIGALAFRQEFSAWEKRALNRLPTRASLADWTLPDDMEAYLADQIPFRQALVSLDAEAQALTGRAVQLGAWPVGDAIVEKPVRAVAAAVEKRVEALREIAGDTPCLFLTPPTAGMLQMDRMTAARRAVYAEEEALYDALTAGAGFVPVKEDFENSGESVYYATDHHWNAHGAYLAYRAYCRSAGLTPLAPDDFEITEYAPFYGSTVARSGLPFRKADTLTCAEPKTKVTLTFDGETYDRLIFPELAASYDGYAAFLRGNHGMTVVENENGEGTLLLFKDSFANSLIPFLAAHYKRIVAVDARYYGGTFRQAAEEAGPADQVLYVYSLDSLANDTSIQRKLGR